MNLIEHADGDALDQAVAARLGEACEASIAATGRARLALAGGSTPMPVYRELARRSLDWPRVMLLPGDERWVAHDDPACNLTAIRQAFAPRPADFRALTPEQPGAVPSLSAALRSWAALDQRLDACLLGM
ncbi:MAG: 6-phosphogluconolactonase, partial [Wenzhouxiangellaceae bacterium]